MRESEVDLQVSKNVSGIRVSLAGGRKRDDPWWLDWSKVWQRLEVEICNWVLVKCHALPMFGCGCPQTRALQLIDSGIQRKRADASSFLLHPNPIIRYKKFRVPVSRIGRRHHNIMCDNHCGGTSVRGDTYNNE